MPFGEQVPEAAYAGFQPRNFIDSLALTKWRRLGIAPSPRASDAEFLRRAMLDAIGTLPTAEEVREFLADTSPDKRANLIDRLLARSEYAGFWANQWGDLLRNKRRYGDGYKRGTFAFAAWIRNAFVQNMPYDQFVAVDSDGAGHLCPTTRRWSGIAKSAIWWHQVNDTGQLFLGTRINCANCHHHPYERWSQDDYWSLAAFFARVGSKQGDVANETRDLRSQGRRRVATADRPGDEAQGPWAVPNSITSAAKIRGKTWWSGWSLPTIRTFPKRSATGCGHISWAWGWSKRSTTCA